MPAKVRPLALVALVAAITIGLVASPAAAEGERDGPDSGDSGLTAIPGPMVVEFRDDLDGHGSHSHDGAGASERVEATDMAQDLARSSTGGDDRTATSSPSASGPAASLELDDGAAVRVGGLNVVYRTTTPTRARAAIEAGVRLWADRLNTGGAPVRIDVHWQSLGATNLLGFAGPADLITGNRLPTGHYYPAALANVLTRTDVNGSTEPEILVFLNSDLDGGLWYYGTGTPPLSQVDLTTVVAHEVGHGLGYLSSASNETGTIRLDAPPFIFDSLVQQNGTPLQRLPNVGRVLTSGNADVRISTSQIAPLHVPAVWREGTSASHVAGGGSTAGSLMTPSLTSGAANRRVDGYTLGVLGQIGWPTTGGPITPAVSSTSINGTSVTVRWQPRNQLTGLPANRFVVEAHVGTTRVASVAVDGTTRSVSIHGLAPRTRHRISVVPVADGRRGQPAQATVTTGDRPAFGQPDPIPSFVADRWLDHQVFRAYQAHFLRAPDRAGFNHWLTQRSRGLPLIDMITQFQTGPEFVNRYGSLTNSRFVTLVYRNVLGRDPDRTGLDFWVDRLNAGWSRARVMEEFAESPEYVRRTSTRTAHSPTEGSIRRLFQAYFLRQPSAADLTYWVRVANSGTSLTTIADFFSASPEFVNRYGRLSDGQFVNLVYRNVIGRPADSAGFSFWTGRLAAGASRGQVMVGFSQSPEFVRSTGTIPPGG